MITFIICSVDPNRSQAVSDNIRQTVGQEVEIMIHDNRALNWGLCRVYNHYSKQAAHELICYLHEDVLFRTPAWGEKILRFYREHPKVGVVGFLGSQIKTYAPSAVGGIVRYEMGSLIQHAPNGVIKSYTQRSGAGDFSRVIQIDGLCMFVPKDVWAAHRFDEQLFDGFHLYDLDFTIHVAQHHRNYVCHNIVVEHASEGAHNDAWYRYTRLFHQKWGDLLPMTSIPLTPRQIRDAESYNAYKFYKKTLKTKRKEHLKFARQIYLHYRLFSHRLRLARYHLKYYLNI